MKPYRYTLYRYSAFHFAIDCEECNCKIANLKRDSNIFTILFRLNSHDGTHHMAKDKPKPQPTNGPYSWGNGPKPHGIIKRIVTRIQGK